MNAKARLCAIVVTHNRLLQLRLTLERLLAEPIDFVVVVDNASTDGTEGWLGALSERRLRTLRLPDNRGGAGGFEAGMRYATDAIDPDWLVLMDDDGRPAPGAIDAFRAADLTGVDALAAAVHYPDGRICEMNRPWVNPFWHPRILARTALGGGRAGFHIPDGAYEGAPRPIDGASFVGFFVSRGAVGRAGFPDGRLFLYGDDVIYTLGLSRSGARIAFRPDVRFEHDCSTFAVEGPRAWSPLWKAYYNYRNGLLGYRRAAGPILFWPVLAMVLPKWALTARRYGKNRGRFLSILRLAVGDALTATRRPHHEVLARAEEGR